MKFNHDEKDVFARRQQAALLKIEILKKHPEMYEVNFNEMLKEMDIYLEMLKKASISKYR